MKVYAQNQAKPQSQSHSFTISSARQLLQAKAQDHETDPDMGAIAGFAHDFSRIPVSSTAQLRLQAKLTVNSSQDVFEQEADQISDRIMRVPEAELQRACACGGRCSSCQVEQAHQERERVQTKHVGPPSSGQTAAPQIVHTALASSGQPLDPATRGFMEPRFGHDFSGVRVHSNPEASSGAKAVHARAYTVGRDIVFGAGEYAPTTTQGKQLLAHELTHVLQQSTATRSPFSSIQASPILTAGSVIQRLTKQERQEDLQAPRYAGNVRLEAAFDNAPAMHSGETNDGVRLVQEGLVAGGFPMPESTKPSGELDGAFGQETFTTVKLFQTEHGLSVDGIVGRETLGKLDQQELARGGGPDDPVCSCPQGQEPVTDDEVFTDAFAFGEKKPLAGLQLVGDGDAKARKCPACKSTSPKPGVCPGDYSKAERDASRSSDGQFDQPNSVGPTIAQEALMWDFEPGQTTIRGKHQTEAMQMVSKFGLGSSGATAKIAILLGHTDCVDKESLNFRLRQGRAQAARELFKELGVPDDDIGSAEPATQGPVPGDDSTAEGRARNRSVVIVLVPPTFPDLPPEPERPKRTCNAISDSGKNWSLESVANVAAAGSVGGGVFGFILKNCDTGCEYECVFRGFGGGVCLGASLSLPDRTKFTTPTAPVNAKNFQGDASVFSSSIEIGPVAVGTGFIKLRAVKTDPVDIGIGGFEAGFGGKVCVIGLEGTFYVRNKGFPRQPCLP